ncbi:unnamed protein product [Blepharisma stoltei]|uniref:Uncharacterized protein n=1 Tax=Blepharisma stoltei TaxID=1481888 RepID=A0AAU9K4L0_9CILI|nr:unnamed protein product [Blepharisma stoltei]
MKANSFIIYDKNSKRLTFSETLKTRTLRSMTSKNKREVNKSYDMKFFELNEKLCKVMSNSNSARCSPENILQRKKSTSTEMPNITLKIVPKKQIMPFEYDPIPSPLRWKQRYPQKSRTITISIPNRHKPKTPSTEPTKSQNHSKINYIPYLPLINQIIDPPSKPIIRQLSREDPLISSWEHFTPRDSGVL